MEEENSAEEQAFLVALYKYMKERDTPIERIPFLGFKQSECRVVDGVLHCARAGDWGGTPYSTPDLHPCNNIHPAIIDYSSGPGFLIVEALMTFLCLHHKYQDSHSKSGRT